MSEQSGNATPTGQQPAQAATPTPKDVATQQGKPAQETDWVSEARKWEQRAKENKDAATEAANLRAQLDQIQKAQMSDLERAQAEAKAASEAATKAQAEALRWRIAAKHGITDEDAETFLTGSDEDTLTRQAERLQALAANAPTSPKPDLSQGGQGGAPTQTVEQQFAAWASNF